MLESVFGYVDAVEKRGINSIDPREHVARPSASWVLALWVLLRIGLAKS